MPTQYHIVDNVTSDPERYLLTWNTTIGEVLTTTTEYIQALPFSSPDLRDAAITKINNCAANSGKFIGHVPPPPKH